LWALRSRARVSGADLQLPAPVVDDQRAQRAEHVHADQHGRALLQLPQAEYVDVAIDGGDVRDVDVPELDGRRLHVIAGLFVLAQADDRGGFDFAANPAALHQRIAQRDVAERALGAGVDDRLDRDAADASVDNQQLAEPDARRHRVIARWRALVAGAGNAD